MNDLLDNSKIESGYLVLEKENFDLVLVFPFLFTSIQVFNIDLYTKPYTTTNALEATQVLVTSDVKLINNCEIPARTIVRGDSHRLTQILINILSNAIKFTPKGEIGYDAEFGRTEIQNGVAKREVLFSVRDTGIGMDAASLQRLFKPFSQVKKEKY